MSLVSIEYSEYEGQPEFWEIQKLDLSHTNLVVGKNATGKSRLVNVVSGLCKILARKITSPFESGRYSAQIQLGSDNYGYEIAFDDLTVVGESLTVNGEQRLLRGPDGIGEIYYEKEGRLLEFQAPSDTISLQLRNDALQHSYIEKLSVWAAGFQTYHFGSSEGRNTLASMKTFESAKEDSTDLTVSYGRAYNEYGDAFDRAIIRDMKRLGFDLFDVGVRDMRDFSQMKAVAEPVLGIFVGEKERNTLLPQFLMSQGMYRALGLVIQMNIALRSGRRTLLLVDDVGEGLDYARSASLIELLVDYAKRANIQLFATSNDQFVMNHVPLEYWRLLQRNGGSVRAYTAANSPKEFGEFKFMGLSNFDFFSSARFGAS